MIDHTGVQQAGLSLNREAISSGRAARDQETDFDFWRQVFDDARGQGMADGGQAPAQNGQTPEIGPGFKRTFGTASPSMTASVGQLPGVAPSMGSTSSATATVSDRSSTDAPGNLITVGGRVFPAGAVWSRPSSLVHALGEARNMPVAEVSPELSRAVQADTAVAVDGLPTGLQAHVMQTASGDWNVALRSSRPLSVAQALAAVARAMGQEGMPHGQVERVMLNGQRIYQQPRRSNSAGTIVFELNC